MNSQALDARMRASATTFPSTFPDPTTNSPSLKRSRQVCVILNKLRIHGGRFRKSLYQWDIIVNQNAPATPANTRRPLPTSLKDDADCSGRSIDHLI